MLLLADAQGVRGISRPLKSQSQQHCELDPSKSPISPLQKHPHPPSLHRINRGIEPTAEEVSPPYDWIPGSSGGIRAGDLALSTRTHVMTADLNMFFFSSDSSSALLTKRFLPAQHFASLPYPSQRIMGQLNTLVCLVCSIVIAWPLQRSSPKAWHGTVEGHHHGPQGKKVSAMTLGRAAAQHLTHPQCQVRPSSRQLRLVTRRPREQHPSIHARQRG